MAEKVYYFLKLPEDFFSDKVMKRLRALPGGDAYTIIALKVLLLGLRTDNIIAYDGLCPTIGEEIAVTVDEQPEAVQVVLGYLERSGWIQIREDSSIYSAKGAEMTTSITSRGLRLQKQKEREKALPAEGAEETSATLPQEFRRSSVEIELEKELEVEKETPFGGKERESGECRFPPTPTDVQAYLDELGVKSFTGEDFCDHYSGIGWKVGQNRMTAWKPIVKRWMRQDRTRCADGAADGAGRQTGAAQQRGRRVPRVQSDVTDQFSCDVAKEVD